MHSTCRKLLASATISLLLTGCIFDDDDNPAVNPYAQLTAADSRNCTIELETGRCFSVTIDDVERYYYIIEPSTYRAENGVLMVVHGLGDTLDWQNEWFHATEMAERTGRLLILPRGTFLDNFRPGKQVWNASAACCYFDALIGKPAPDDIAFLRAALDEVNDAFSITPGNAVLWGYSNGAFLSNRFACEQSRLVSAVITQSGTMRADPQECQPENPVSSFQIHGTLDQAISFQGDTTDRDVVSVWKSIPGFYTRGYYPGADEVTQRWLTVNACDTSQVSSSAVAGITTHDSVTYLEDHITVPNEELAVLRNATLTRYDQCDGERGVQQMVIDQGTHKPVYDPDVYLPIIESFIDNYGGPRTTQQEDVADRAHDTINDNGSSVVALSGGDLAGAAWVRRHTDNSWLIRASFSDVAPSDRISALRLRDSLDNILAETTTPYISNRYAYATLTNVSGTPTTVEVVVDDQVLTGSVTLGSVVPVLRATFTDGGDTVGILDIRPTAATRMEFVFQLPTTLDPADVSAIGVGSDRESFTLFPIPSGLPDPDDYDGDETFWDIVKTGGFPFSRNEDDSLKVNDDGNYFVEGFAEDKGSAPYYYEEMVGAPGNFTATVTLDGVEYTATLSRQ